MKKLDAFGNITGIDSQKVEVKSSNCTNLISVFNFDDELVGYVGFSGIGSLCLKSENYVISDNSAWNLVDIYKSLISVRGSFKPIYTIMELIKSRLRLMLRQYTATRELTDLIEFAIWHSSDLTQQFLSYIVDKPVTMEQYNYPPEGTVANPEHWLEFYQDFNKVGRYGFVKAHGKGRAGYLSYFRKYRFQVSANEQFQGSWGSSEAIDYLEDIFNTLYKQSPALGVAFIHDQIVLALCDFDWNFADIEFNAADIVKYLDLVYPKLIENDNFDWLIK